MINIKRPQNKTESVTKLVSEHLFEIAAVLFAVLILGLGTYIIVKSRSGARTTGSVAGVQTFRADETNTDLLNTIAKESNYKYFYDALTRTGLYQLLQNDSEYTVLIPSDSAFKAINEVELNNIFSDNNRLTQLVKNHIVRGKLDRLDFDKVEFMKAESGKSITIKSTNLGTLFNTAKLMSSGKEASNGVYYELDSVLLN
ncbi:MAG: fasciclin domain-containing protein [Ignavibacteriaceae bacterium]|nr:fasciclin domain-containing protein [Ignavibacteriaceae bacterium]